MAKTFDPYRTLGLRRDAIDKEIKAAHRKLAKRFHPDAGAGAANTERFLDIQEAYRVLSDPLLRREWDSRHAPGPLRADQPINRRQPRPRQQAAPPEAADQARRPPPPPLEEEPVARRPRSSRAYTWSASEVPWWEEGSSENRRQPGRRRRAADPAAAAPGGATAQDEPPPHSHGPGAPPEAANPFDVYNRSSGAAWSMAARAYFRRGDQELPRRGTFRYEGTQVLTAARARAAAENEARRKQAQHRHPPGAGAGAGAGAGPAAATRQTVAYDARRAEHVRQTARRRASAQPWPSLPERLVYALLAWLPVAIIIGYGGAAVTGCDSGGLGCPRYLETAQAISIAVALGLFVALPKVAYVGAWGSAGALLLGVAVVALVAVMGAPVPLDASVVALIGASLLIGYAAAIAFVLVRDRASRPWSPVAAS
ncbi:MAG: J domain-containing protein [Candidatus Limnocylindrales bacterium]